MVVTSLGEIIVGHYHFSLILLNFLLSDATINRRYEKNWFFKIWGLYQLGKLR